MRLKFKVVRSSDVWVLFVALGVVLSSRSIVIYIYIYIVVCSEKTEEKTSDIFERLNFNV